MKRPSIGFLLKLGFVVALLYFLSQKGFLSLTETGRALSEWQLILPAICGIVLCVFLGVVRWKWLLEAQGIRLSWKRAVELNFVGLFFNIALPGAVSGDLVKAFYIGREVEGARSRAFGSILFDRVAGISALALVASGAMLFSLDIQSLGGLRTIIFTSGIVTLIGYAYLFFLKPDHDPLLRALRTLESRIPRAGSVVRIYEGVRTYHDHPYTVLRVVLLSLVIHWIVGWACLQFAHALGEEHLSVRMLYVIVPLGLLVTAIPVMPAGVGTGHAAFVFLFKLLGSQRGADVFSLFALVQIVLGMAGGLVYLRFRGKEEPISPSF